MFNFDVRGLNPNIRNHLTDKILKGQDIRIVSLLVFVFMIWEALMHSLITDWVISNIRILLDWCYAETQEYLLSIVSISWLTGTVQQDSRPDTQATPRILHIEWTEKWLNILYFHGTLDTQNFIFHENAVFIQETLKDDLLYTMVNLNLFPT